MTSFFSNLFSSNKAKELEVLQAIDVILQEEASWSQQGEFKTCDNTNGYTLQCALIAAYESVYGNYRHRGKASRLLRKMIKKNSNEKYCHPIFEFNNSSTTKFADVKMIIQRAVEHLKS